MKHVVFKTINIVNFLSIGSPGIHLDFEKGVNVITGENLDKGGRNGVGKSSLLEAFYWCCFGTPMREVKQEKLIHNQVKKGCAVTLEFDVIENDIKSSYTLKRTLGPGSLSLKKGEEDLSLSSIPKTTEVLMELTGINEKVFLNAIIMSTNNALPFMAQGKIDKRKFVEGILNLGIFGEMLLKIRTDYNEKKKENDIESTRFVEKQRNQRQYKEQIDINKETKAAKLSDLETRLASLKASIASIEPKEDIASVEEELIKREGQLAALKQSVERITTSYEESVTSVERTKASIQRLKQEQTNLGIRQRSLKERLDAIKEEGDVGQKIVEIEIQIDSKEIALEGIEKNIKEVLNKDLQESYIQIRETSSIIEKLEEEISSLKEKGGACPTCKRLYDVEDPVTHKKILEEAEDRLNILRNLLTKENNNYKQYKSLHETATDDIERIKEEIKDLNDKKFSLSQSSVQIIQIEVSYNDVVSELEVNKESFDSQQTVLEQHLATYNTNKGNVLKVKEGIELLQTKIAGLKETKAAIQSAKTQLIHLQERNKELEGEIQNLKDTKDSFETLYEEVSTEVGLIEANMEVINKRLAVLDTAKFVVSEEGVKTYIIKKMLDLLNSRLNHYLQILEAPCKCEFNELFEEIIYNDKGIECSYHNFSGGERKRIDFAVLFMFQDILRVQTGTSFSVSMYDELFDSAIDQIALDKILSVLKSRVEEFNESVYIISHNKAILNSGADRSILLEKSGGKTRIVEIK